MALSISRHKKIILWALALILGFGGYLAWGYLKVEPLMLPREFLEARLRGAEIASMIVEASDETPHELEEINQLDRAGSSTEALDRIAKEVIRNKALRENALLLSGELTKMANAVSEINQEEARRSALQAVHYEVTLLNRLLTYNSQLGQLLSVLQEKFEQKKPSGPSVSELVASINAEVDAINNLNAKFKEEMQKLEDATRVRN